MAPRSCAVGSMFTAAVCTFTHHVNRWIGVDDSSQSFNLHGIGGIVGGIAVGVFASPHIAGLDGVTDIEGGWIFHHWKQMRYQLAPICCIVGWASIVTVSLCYIINYIPGCAMRVPYEAEEMGWDLYEMGQCADPMLVALRAHSNVEYLNSEDAHSLTKVSKNRCEIGVR